MSGRLEKQLMVQIAAAMRIQVIPGTSQHKEMSAEVRKQNLRYRCAMDINTVTSQGERKQGRILQLTVGVLMLNLSL